MYLAVNSSVSDYSVTGIPIIIYNNVQKSDGTINEEQQDQQKNILQNICHIYCRHVRAWNCLNGFLRQRRETENGKGPGAAPIRPKR